MIEIDKKIVVEMEKTAKALNLPEDILQTAIEFFKTLHQEGFVKSRSAVGIAMACLYYTIKLDPSCPAITLKEFTDKTPCLQKEISRFYRKMVEKFGMQPQVCTLRPIIFVKAFGKKIGFRKESLEYAVKLAEDSVEEKAYMGKNPAVWASACLYAASLKFQEGITQDEITHVTNCQQVSMRKILKEHPFFSRIKFFVTAPKMANRELLKKLIQKLPSIYPQGIPVAHLRQALRCSFAEDLKGYFMPTSEPYKVVEDLEIEGLAKRIPGPSCEKRSASKEEPVCIRCSWSYCNDFIVQTQKISIVP
jgi:transcription initiation factor TFIIIB Brf1 subunit/transcription initiation factor TFIIB